VKRVFFGPAFALIARFGLRVNYALAIALFVLAQAIALSMLGGAGAASVHIAVANGEFVSSLPAVLVEQSGTAALMLATMLLSIYLLAAIAFWTTAGMDRMRKIIERVASGDLSGHGGAAVAGKSHDIQSGALWQAVAQMTRNLVQIVTQVRTSADHIALGAKEIAAGNTHLSQRTEEQAASLEETSSSMEEMAATVKQNADNCKLARATADDVSKITAQAAERMRELAQTMGKIEDGSRRVADITGVIESIAFQTNILALNAAVEAARAGDQGRGFAVVAAEVRSLAQRSATAGKEIKGLIKASVGSVAQGAALVDEAGATMEKVLDGVRHVNDRIGEIAEASSEQSTGIEQISRAVSQLDHVTQQNAALVEEAASAALSFDEEAARLVDVVGTFKLDHMEDRDNAVALVKKAVAHLQAVGLEQACRDFKDPNGGFMHGEFYVFVNDINGVQLCNPHSPDTDGKNTITKMDAHGKEFVRAYIEVAKTKGQGWHDYHHVNPVTEKVELKSAYVELVDNVVLGCGTYKTEPTPVAASVPPRVSAAARKPRRALKTAG